MKSSLVLLLLSAPALFGGTCSVTDYGANGTDSLDDTTAIQNAINSGCKNIYLPTGRYLIGSAGLHFGTSTTAIIGVRFYGDAAWENGAWTTRGSALVYTGAANGTAVEVTNAQGCVFENFAISGGNVAGIGLLIDNVNSVASTHQNIFRNIAISAVPGTPGIGLLLSGNRYSLTNQDTSNNDFYDMAIFPGFEGVASSVKIGIQQEGTQTVSNKFYNTRVLSFTQKGVYIKDGDAAFTDLMFQGPSTGSNVTDFYVENTASWVNVDRTYSEILASSSPSTRKAFYFPTGTRTHETTITGARVMWNLTSGTPISYDQQGPLTLTGATIDWSGGTQGVGTIYLNNANSAAQDLMTFGNHYTIAVTKTTTGNWTVR